MIKVEDSKILQSASRMLKALDMALVRLSGETNATKDEKFLIKGLRIAVMITGYALESNLLPLLVTEMAKIHCRLGVLAGDTTAEDPAQKETLVLADAAIAKINKALAKEDVAKEEWPEELEVDK